MPHISELEKCPVCTFNKFIGEKCTMCPLLDEENTDE